MEMALSSKLRSLQLFSDLNTSDGNGAKEINTDVRNLCAKLLTGFNNSFYSLLQAKGEEN